MKLNEETGLIVPQRSEHVYLPAAGEAARDKLTWVEETLGYTVNGCYKVRDTSGHVRIVKRHRSKDKPGLRAWVSLN